MTQLRLETNENFIIIQRNKLYMAVHEGKGLMIM